MSRLKQLCSTEGRNANDILEELIEPLSDEVKKVLPTKISLLNKIRKTLRDFKQQQGEKRPRGMVTSDEEFNEDDENQANKYLAFQVENEFVEQDQGESVKSSTTSTVPPNDKGNDNSF